MAKSESFPHLRSDFIRAATGEAEDPDAVVTVEYMLSIRAEDETLALQCHPKTCLSLERVCAENAIACIDGWNPSRSKL